MKQVLEYLTFLLVCAASGGGLGLLARLAERALPERRKHRPTRRVAVIGVCAAIAGLLCLLEVPLLFLAPEFYRLDLSEIPVLLCGFYLGPSATVACEGVKILVKLLLKGTTTAYIGEFANFLVGCFFALPASLWYHIHHSRHRAVAGLAVGTVCMTVLGSGFNALYLLPKFADLYGLPLDSILAMGTRLHSGVRDVFSFVLLCVVPLNLIKGLVVSGLTLVLYKRLARRLFDDCG